MNHTLKNGQAKLRLTADDFKWQYMTAGGHGGQNVQKTATAVRCVHPESGATGNARDERSQFQNRRLAFQRCTSSPQFKFWCAQKMQEIEDGETIEQKVERDMRPENLRIEVKNEIGQWVEESEVEAP